MGRDVLQRRLARRRASADERRWPYEPAPVAARRRCRPPLARRDCERRVVVRVRAVEAGERAGRRLVEADAEEKAARCASGGSPRAAPRRPRRSPAERAVAPSARNAPWRSPRGASWPSPAQRFPPTVPCERISRSATFAAHGPSGAGMPTSSWTGVIAPIVTREPSLLDRRTGRRSPEHQRLRALQPSVRQVGDDDRPSADDDDVRAVAEAAIASSSEPGTRTSRSRRPTPHSLQPSPHPSRSRDQ